MIQIDKESLCSENYFPQMWKKQFNRVSTKQMSMFERVPSEEAHGKKTRCLWLAEMKKRVSGPFMSSRLLKVAHGVRSFTFVDTTALTCMKIISRVASLKNVKGLHTREFALYDISVAILHNCQRMSRLECSWRRTQKGVLTKRDELRSRYVTKSITALRRTRWQHPKTEGECCRGR